MDERKIIGTVENNACVWHLYERPVRTTSTNGHGAPHYRAKARCESKHGTFLPVDVVVTLSADEAARFGAGFLARENVTFEGPQPIHRYRHDR